MQELVFIDSQRVGEEPYTTADVIAEYAGITHRSINRIITIHLKRLNHFGKVRFKITPLPSGQGTKIYYLSEQQATLLITFLKNTPRVADFKEELVKQFFEMRRELMRQQTAFEAGKDVSKDLHQAIHDSVQFTSPNYDYMNVNKLVYHYALGISGAQLRKQRHVKASHSITEYLSADEAAAMQRVKGQIIMLIEMNLDRDAIKSVLERQGILYQVTLPVKKGETAQ